MLSSLRVRLLLTLVIVVGVALGTMAVYTSHVTTREFERSVAGILRYRDPRLDIKITTIQKFITQFSGEGSIWEELQQQLELMGNSSRLRFVLANLSGTILIDSKEELVSKTLDTKQSKPIAVFLIEGIPVLAYFEPFDAPNLHTIQSSFTSSVNRSLLLAILIAGLFTILLTWLLSHSILKPVSALIAATRKMESGDLSQRVHVRATGELGELARAFNAMADGLQRLEQLRRNMVTDVAHELRTPLSNIRGYLEAIQDGILHPTPLLIASLHEETMLLKHLVDDLQELALVEAGQLRLERQVVDLAQSIQKAVITAGQKAVAKNLTLQVELPNALPPLWADPERLAQILHNLLENAIQYTPQGGSISILVREGEGELEVCVQDTGIGIAPEHLDFVFERFYRVDRSRNRTTGGAGLGLAIVKQLVEVQGGHVIAESSPGTGTTIRFTLPIAPEADNDPVDNDQSGAGNLTQTLTANRLSP